MIHLTVRRPLTLTGYSGLYSTERSVELKPEIVLAGSEQEQDAFNDHIKLIVAKLEEFADAECEAVICCILGPTQNTYTGSVEAWDDEYARTARDIIVNIQQLCEAVAALGGQSTATIKLSLSRLAVKKAA